MQTSSMMALHVNFIGVGFSVLILFKIKWEGLVLFPDPIFGRTV